MNEKELSEAVLSLFRYTINGTLPDSSMLDGLTEERVQACFDFADRFDLAHLLCYGLKKLGKLPENPRYQKKLLEAFWRWQRLTYERKRIGEALEAAQIDHVFLKAPILQPLYPEPWLRTSADVDVLVKDADHAKALRVLCKKLGCTQGKRTAHDVELLLANDFHAEVHFALMDEQTSIEQTLSRVWDTAKTVPGKRFEKQFSPEMFYFYYVAHMARHFINGGCGMKAFLDLWLMEQGMEKDELMAESLLRVNGLLTFAREAERLAAYWMGGQAPGGCTEEFERFILSGGVYGSIENKVAAMQLHFGGRGKFLFERIVEPREVMERHYPQLKERGWMLPYYRLHRWTQALTDGKLSRRIREVALNQSTTNDSTKNLMKELELQ